MFTGIITHTGRIVQVSPSLENQAVRVIIETCNAFLDDVRIGNSIAINGACMTVVQKSVNTLTVDISSESLRCTTGLNRMGARLNLEKALRLSDRLDGHLVLGHVDGIGQVIQWLPCGESHILSIKAPNTLARYLAPKGSVIVNGVCLTINFIEDQATHCLFTMNVIAHTLAVTTLRQLALGQTVNLEVDLIARYMDRILACERQTPARVS